jgi:hypothetical protein
LRECERTRACECCARARGMYAHSCWEFWAGLFQ